MLERISRVKIPEKLGSCAPNLVMTPAVAIPVQRQSPASGGTSEPARLWDSAGRAGEFRSGLGRLP
jgi:hypothetical protein